MLIPSEAYISMHWHEGDVIRKLRDSVNWTLADLSRASGVSIQVINRIEKGHTREPKSATLDRLAQAFGLSGSLDLRNAVPRDHLLVVRPRELPPQPAAPTRAAPGVVDLVAPRQAVRKRRRA